MHHRSSQRLSVSLEWKEASIVARTMCYVMKEQHEVSIVCQDSALGDEISSCNLQCFLIIIVQDCAHFMMNFQLFHLSAMYTGDLRTKSILTFLEAEVPFP